MRGIRSPGTLTAGPTCERNWTRSSSACTGSTAATTWSTSSAHSRQVPTASNRARARVTTAGAPGSWSWPPTTAWPKPTPLGPSTRPGSFRLPATGPAASSPDSGSRPGPCLHGPGARGRLGDPVPAHGGICAPRSHTACRPLPPVSASSSLRWLADDRVAVRWIREDAGRRAGCRLRELVDPPEVFGADAVVDRSAVRREPRVDAVRAAVRRAVGGADERVAEHLGLPAGIRDRGPVLLV